MKIDIYFFIEFIHGDAETLFRGIAKIVTLVCFRKTYRIFLIIKREVLYGRENIQNQVFDDHFVRFKVYFRYINKNLLYF